MQDRGKDMAMRRWAVIAVTLVAMMVLLVPIVQAADEYVGRAVYHTLKVESKEVGDVPGHSIASVEQAGLGFFTKGPASGQIATRKNIANLDTVNGKGTFTNNIVYTFRDGSTVVHKATGTITPVDGGKTATFAGTFVVAGGTGKFAGAYGEGTFKGERLGPSETGGDSYVDFTSTQ
jgi:hypothetical protein